MESDHREVVLDFLLALAGFKTARQDFSATIGEGIHIKSEFLLIKYMAEQGLVDANISEGGGESARFRNAQVTRIKHKGMEMLAPFIEEERRNLAGFTLTALQRLFDEPHNNNLLWYQLAKAELDKRNEAERTEAAKRDADAERKENRRHSIDLIFKIISAGIAAASVAVAVWNIILTQQNQRLKEQMFHLSQRVQSLEHQALSGNGREMRPAPKATAPQKAEVRDATNGVTTERESPATAAPEQK